MGQFQMRYERKLKMSSDSKETRMKLEKIDETVDVSWLAPDHMIEESGLFKRYDNNPIIEPDWNHYYETSGTFVPCVVKRGDEYCLLYRAEAETETGYCSRICLATSKDGITFQKYAGNPVLSNDEQGTERPGWGGLYDNLGRYYPAQRGVEDPRVVCIDGMYYMTYTEVNQEGWFLAWAKSRDLVSWKTLGPVLPNLSLCKAGAMLSVPVNGRYYMYFNLNAQMWLAESEDLAHWKMLPEPVMKPRPGHWDNMNTEPGSPPMVLDGKIVMIYDSETLTSPTPGRDCNCAGFAIFDLSDPRKCIARSRRPILRPRLLMELHGAHSNFPATIWGNSLVQVGDLFHLYYHAAEMYCCLATSPVSEKFWEKADL
jgi:predicted GH43/DUF377 family glycosyl hydrolase